MIFIIFPRMCRTKKKSFINNFLQGCYVAFTNQNAIFKSFVLSINIYLEERSLLHLQSSNNSLTQFNNLRIFEKVSSCKDSIIETNEGS